MATLTAPTAMPYIKDPVERELEITALELAQEVKQNLHELVTEWKSFQQQLTLDATISNGANYQTIPIPHDEDSEAAVVPKKLEPGKDDKQTLLVNRLDVEQLATEAMMLKEFLPKVLNTEYLSAISKLTRIEQELQVVLRERSQLTGECEHLQRRVESLMTDYEQEKQEKFTAKSEVTELTQQLSQQADYFSSMGAACCTLLWRVSRHEDCIHSILSGSMVNEFLRLVSSTLQSYLATYSDGLPEESSEEAQFVLALCGIITNIGASAFGREYLASCEDGRSLIDVFCLVLAESPSGPECSKLKNLVLMSLYNISINQKGLRYLTSKPDIMGILVWQLQNEEDVTNKLHSIRLLQSMVMEPESPIIVQQALEIIPLQLLQHLASSASDEIQVAALELMSDLSSLYSSEPRDITKQ